MAFGEPSGAVLFFYERSEDERGEKPTFLVFALHSEAHSAHSKGPGGLCRGIPSVEKKCLKKSIATIDRRDM